MNRRQRVVDVGFKALNAVHRAVLRLSGDRVGGSAFGMSAVELHTIGRRSGRERVTMLTAPVVDGDRIVLVASKGGDDRDPDWFLNAVAHPEVELRIRGEHRLVRARTATAEERAELWPRVVAAYKGYANYQQRTKRDIPLVICEPR
jgi:deazaflavin-dependent oxidoreductase (nitroreductase family)